MREPSVYKTNPISWSKKEILGHLIDSATNNHQRFVRGQFEFKPVIEYNQNKWNEFNYYHFIDSNQLITFWTVYNKQIIELISKIPKENLKKEVKINHHLHTIEFLFIDYVNHLEHHLNQILKK